LYSAGIETVIEIIIDKYSLDKETAFCFSQYIIITFNSYTKSIRGPLIKYFTSCKKEFDTKNRESDGDTKFFVEVPLGTIDMSYLKYTQSTAGFKAVFSDGKTRRQVKPRCIPPRTDAEFDTTNFEKDFIQIRKAFLPNIIHSIDAFVMHKVVQRCKIQKVLVSTIHDAFVVNICDAVKLRRFYIEAIYDLNEAMCDIAEKRGLKGFKRLPKVGDRVTEFKAHGRFKAYRSVRSSIYKILDNSFHFLKP
jgi:hypothetical protein